VPNKEEEMSDSYYSPPATGPQNSGLAIASLIASILGVTMLPTVGSIVGLVLGYLARNQIRDSGGTIGGEGLAKAGIIVGWVGLGINACIIITALVLGIGIPGLAICGGALSNSL
jgi:hypothetical protein